MKHISIIITLSLGFAAATQALDPDPNETTQTLSRPSSNVSLTGYLGDEENTPPEMRRKQKGSASPLTKDGSQTPDRESETPPIEPE